MELGATDAISSNKNQFLPHVGTIHAEPSARHKASASLGFDCFI
jgi:hypothetical protein